MFPRARDLKTIFTVFAILVVLGFGGLHPAQAQDEQGIDILPAKSLETGGMNYENEEATHPPIRLTPDKSEIVRLEHEAGSVIIGNPAHVNILVENSKALVLVPRLPGATFFSVLDGAGNLVMQRHVIVASPKEKYVRIRKSCAGAGTADCTETEVYYCPDMCHAINVATEESAAKAPSADALSGMTGDQGQQDGENTDDNTGEAQDE